MILDTIESLHTAVPISHDGFLTTILARRIGNPTRGISTTFPRWINARRWRFFFFLLLRLDGLGIQEPPGTRSH